MTLVVQLAGIFVFIWCLIYSMYSSNCVRKNLTYFIYMFVLDYKTDVRLHCCLRAKTELCLKLCLKRYSEGDKAVEEFSRRCEFNPLEVST